MNSPTIVIGFQNKVCELANELASIEVTGTFGISKGANFKIKKKKTILAKKPKSIDSVLIYVETLPLLLNNLDSKKIHLAPKDLDKEFP